MESSLLSIQNQHESQIVPNTTTIASAEPSLTLDYDENSIHGSALTNNSSSSSSIIDDTTCSSSNDSFITNSCENYSLDMFSLENLLSSSSSTSSCNKNENIVSYNDDNDDTQTYEMDCINEIIDDICKNSDFTNVDYTENDFDCTISDLANYIDGSPEKQSFSMVENVSPVKNTTVRSLNESFVCETKIPNITMEILKPADNIDIKSLNHNNACPSLSPTTSLTPSTLNNSSNAKNIPKKTRKPRAKKDTTPKSCIQQMLRKNSEVTHKYKALVENKNNFRPLDFLQSVYSLKLDNSTNYSSYNYTKSTRSSINNHQSLSRTENHHVKDKKKIFQNNLADSQSKLSYCINKHQSLPSFNRGKVNEIKKCSPSVIKYEPPLEVFNETDIKQNLICLKPNASTNIKDIVISIQPKRQIVDIKPLSSIEQILPLPSSTPTPSSSSLPKIQNKKKTISVTRTINLPNNVKITQEQKYTTITEEQ